MIVLAEVILALALVAIMTVLFVVARNQRNSIKAVRVEHAHMHGQLQDIQRTLAPNLAPKEEEVRLVERRAPTPKPRPLTWPEIKARAESGALDEAQ